MTLVQLFADDFVCEAEAVADPVRRVGMFFLRIYAQDFDPAARDRIVARLRSGLAKRCSRPEGRRS